MARTKSLAQRVHGGAIPDDVLSLAADLGHDFNKHEIATAFDAAGQKGFSVGHEPTLAQLDAVTDAFHGGRLIDAARRYARAEAYAVLTGGAK